MTKKTMVLLAILVYVFIRSFFVEPNSLEVTKYRISNSQLAGIRLVFLSDLHLKKGQIGKLNKIIKLVKKQNPDLILLGGDFSKNKNYKSAINMNTLALKFHNINVPVFAVLGNYDWWANGEKIQNAFENNGVSVLENSNRRIIIKGRFLDIIGIADLTTREPDIYQAFRRTRTPRIVITHNPDVYFDILDETSLILAGHTHGGQFIIPYTPPLFVPSKFGAGFASGLIKEKTGNQMIITRGVGTSKVPFRLNCKPEIVVVDFVN